MPWQVASGDSEALASPFYPRDSTQAPAPFDNPDAPWAKVIGRRFDFSLAGGAYIVTTIVLVLGAINGQNNLLFWLFGLGVAGMIISGLLSGSALMGVRIRREVLTSGAVGEPLRVRYTVRNRNWIMPAFGLVIEEVPLARRWFAPNLGATWQERMPQPRAFVAYVRPRGEVSVDCAILPARRGEAHFLPLRVWSTFPFGIAKKSIIFAHQAGTLIRPRAIAPPTTLLRDARSGGHGAGQLTPNRSGSETFALRDFQQGDSIRAVAWRASARLDRAIVRTFGQPPSQEMYVVPLLQDSTFPNEHEATNEHVVSVCAGVATRAVAQGMEAGLLAPSGNTIEPARSGRRQIDCILETLARWEHASAAAEPTTPRRGTSRRVILVGFGARPDTTSPAFASATYFDAATMPMTQDADALDATTTPPASHTSATKPSIVARVKAWLREQMIGEPTSATNRQGGGA